MCKTLDGKSVMYLVSIVIHKTYVVVRSRCVRKDWRTPDQAGRQPGVHGCSHIASWRRTYLLDNEI